MKKLLHGGNGAIAGVVTWVAVWALPAVVLEGLGNLGVETPITYAIDMWPQTLVPPGLLGGLLFSALLAMTGGRRGLEERSAAGLCVLGAAIGLALGVVAVPVLTGDAFPAPAVWAAGTVLGAAAAAASALVFRFLARRPAPAAARTP